MIQKLLQYYHNNLVILDRLINALIGGSPDQSISARLWKNFPNSFMRKFVDFLFGKNHCQNSANFDDGVREILK